jgi:hypothetical protein
MPRSPLKLISMARASKNFWKKKYTFVSLLPLLDPSLFLLLPLSSTPTVPLPPSSLLPETYFPDS